MWMADAVIGTCVSSCDQSVAGADEGNQGANRNTPDAAVSRGSRRAFARVHARGHLDLQPNEIFRGVELDDSIDVRISEGERIARSSESRTTNFLRASLHARAA